MAVPFLSAWKSRARTHDEVIVIDVGMRVTKAGWFRMEGGEMVLAGFCLVEAPQGEKRLDAENLTEHFKNVVRALNAPTKEAIIVLGPEESRLYHTDLPAIGLHELRRMLRVNSRNFVQEDLSGYLVDCFLVPNYQPSKNPEPAGAAVDDAESGGEKQPGAKAAPQPAPAAGGRGSQKVRGLVAAMKTNIVEAVRGAATAAELSVQSITVGQVAVCNAFKLFPGASQKEVVALVDIGFKTSTISIVMNGVMMLSRVVAIGADAITSGLAETLNITYSVAEGIKQVMPEKVQGKLQGLLSPLAQELRASIDFFEHQYEKSVAEVLVSGGTARSKLAVQLLELETAIPCKSWNPASNVKLGVAGEQAAELAKEASQMVVTIGTAVSWFDGELAHLNMLAEELAETEARRRDPVRRGIWVSGGVFCFMLLWVVFLGFKYWRMNRELSRQEQALESVRRLSESAMGFSRQAFEIDRKWGVLQQITTNRFQWAPVLNALQFSMVPEIQLTRLGIDRVLDVTPGKAAVTNSAGVVTPATPARGVERVTLSIQAKDYSKAQGEFIQAIERQEYFKAKLKARGPTQLINQAPPQADPTRPEVVFELFEIECYFADRLFRDEAGP